MKSSVTCPCLQELKGSPVTTGVITDGWASVARDTLLIGTRDEGGKMNSLLRWRHRCPRFHPAIYSSGRARSQSCHSIPLLFKSPISAIYQPAHDHRQETVKKKREEKSDLPSV